MSTKRTIGVLPRSYQPTRVEREEQFKINASPQQLAKAILKPVEINERDLAAHRARKRSR